MLLLMVAVLGLCSLTYYLQRMHQAMLALVDIASDVRYRLCVADAYYHHHHNTLLKSNHQHQHQQRRRSMMMQPPQQQHAPAD